MKKKSYFLFIAAAMLLTLFSCTKDKTTGAVVNCTGVSATTNIYNNANANANVSNIINTYCNYAPCHDANTHSGSEDMSSYAGLVTAFKNNNVIGALKGQIELMPKGGPALPDSIILQLQCWQQNGYAGQ